jgi:D-tyrosyl-tRNA(Tyr) deacylase
MRAVIQRVSGASVIVEGKTVGAIGPGLLVLLGVRHGDTEENLIWLVDKISGLRIFRDEQDKMNLSIGDVRGEVLVVSQFTLYGDCRKGRRPGFEQAALPEAAEPLYRRCLGLFRERGFRTEAGVFGAVMQVALVNDGPVTFVIDSP